MKLTIAHHGGGFGENAEVYTGPPVGFLIRIGGKTVYNAGDTGLFYDMKLIGELNSIDLAFLPIGDNFTMGAADAARAVEFVKPKVAIPMHWNTFDVIAVDPAEFVNAVGATAEVVVLEPGQQYEL